MPPLSTPGAATAYRIMHGLIFNDDAKEFCLFVCLFVFVFVLFCWFFWCLFVCFVLFCFVLFFGTRTLTIK